MLQCRDRESYSYYDKHKQDLRQTMMDQSVSLLMEIHKKNLINEDRYNEILEKCKISLLQNNLFTVTTNMTILCISQTPIFQALGALVLKGEFINYQGFD